jgi:hypothetical protein
MEVSGLLHAPAALPLGRKLATHSIGRRLGPTAGLVVWWNEKPLAPTSKIFGFTAHPQTYLTF